MTVVSSKEFAINQRRIYNIALNERVVIRRGKNIFHLTSGNTDNDYVDLMEAKAYADDENTSLADFKKYVSELAK
jgi:predicted transcriptional regulator